MSDEDKLERQNRQLRKRLDRLSARLRLFEGLQGQHDHLLRAVMEQVDAERAESERLLLNILPEPIARRLRAGEGVIADRYEAASVLFADMVGFTRLTEALPADEMVGWLNELYSAFDGHVQARGVEKIRTIGDNYMVASGVPFPREDHAEVLVDFALDLRDAVAAMPPIGGEKVGFRIGINSGPVVGGVIGTHKFQYDIWGDVVNTAARMESHGEVDRIQVTAATHALIADRFVCEHRGAIPIKGKGAMETWFVVGRR